MENCKDLDRLFSNNGVVVSFDDELSLTQHYRKENYYFDGEQLMFDNGKRSEIKYIFAYTHFGICHDNRTTSFTLYKPLLEKSHLLLINVNNLYFIFKACTSFINNF